jgi:filamentous hemagglutinin
VGGTYSSGSGTTQDSSQVGKGKEGETGWSVSGWDYQKDREQIVRATVGAGEIVVRKDAETGADSTAGLNRDVGKAYEITKDEESRTDLYASSSSLGAVASLKIDIANILAEERGVSVLLRGSNTPSGDATIRLPDGTRLRAEFKTFETPDAPVSELTDNRIKRIFERNISTGSSQLNGFPSAVVIDARALSLSSEQVAGYIDRALNNVVPKRPELERVFAITQHGVIQMPIVRGK